MSSSTPRRRALHALAAAGLGTLLPGARAASWPEKPVRVILPFPGGASENLTRFLMERLQNLLGQTFIGEPRSGAGGNIGMEATLQAPADGYTAVSATIGTLTINQFIYQKMPYDPERDFVQISRFWEAANGFVISADHPANSVSEFLTWARQQPKGVSFGSAGVGSSPHLSGELFRLRTGLNAIHVPFRGAAQSIPALVARQTDFAIDSIGSYSAMVRAKRVKLLAVASQERWPAFPEVPTMMEAGVPNFVSMGWGSIVVRRGTPAEVIERFSQAIRSVCNEPAVRQRFLEMGAQVVIANVEESEAYARAERVKWQEAVRAGGVKAE